MIWSRRVVTFLLSLVGLSPVYETKEEVAEVLAESCFSNLPGRAQAHSKGAGRLTDALAFQPGLVTLHDELHDTWHYLVALKSRARDLGYTELTETLGAAADAALPVLQAVARAAEQTVPAPETPLRK
jgi:hypothetical protein